MKMHVGNRQFSPCLAHILEILFTSFIQCYTMRMQCFLVYTPSANVAVQARAQETSSVSYVFDAGSLNKGSE
jgi:hypothetical protein